MGEGAVRNLMQAAIKVALSRCAIRCLLALAVAAAGVGLGSMPSASAQVLTYPAEGPPVTMAGWRYEKGASDVHLFHCEAAACAPGSRISYRFYPAGTTMTLNQFRSEQDIIVKALQQRAPPGTKIAIVGIEGEDGGVLPRMYKARRLTVAPNGLQEHVHSGLVLGDKAAVSLISSSRDEKAAGANYAQYGVGVLLLVQTPRDKQK
jgi:hypothetical protein